MANSWSIKIIKQGDGTVAFQPDLPGSQPGQPLGVKAGDNVTWNNQTDDAHWPVSTNPPGVFLCDDIPAGDVSDPIFNVTATVEYACKHHPEEVGSIVVV